MRLRNKVAVVTGAASGFGKGIAETFAREGARVAVVDINEAAAQAVAASIGGGAIALGCDVARHAVVARTVAAAIDAYGRIDVLVNNAGTTHLRGPLLEVDEAEFDRIFAVNVKSIFLFAKEVVPHFRQQGGGVIINMGSTAAIVHLMSRSMAVELAPDNIRVFALAPVAGETPLLPTFLGGDTEELRAGFRATVPLGRLSTPQDIANAALFLASDDAEFLTGNILEIDGGRCV